jgi:hypothetical protein
MIDSGFVSPWIYQEFVEEFKQINDGGIDSQDNDSQDHQKDATHQSSNPWCPSHSTSSHVSPPKLPPKKVATSFAYENDPNLLSKYAAPPVPPKISKNQSSNNISIDPKKIGINNPMLPDNTKVDIDRSLAASAAQKAVKSGAAAQLMKGAKFDGEKVTINPKSAAAASKTFVSSGAATDLFAGTKISTAATPASKKPPGTFIENNSYGAIFRPPPKIGESAQIFVAPPSMAQSCYSNPAPPKPSRQKSVVAICDFDAVEPSDLGFKKGDIIAVLEVVDENWTKGTILGKEGIFPTSYTAPV